MIHNIIRGLLSTAAGITFLYFMNSASFFNRLDMVQATNDYVVLILLLSFLPMLVSTVFMGEENSMGKNILINGSYFFAGLIIAQGAFVAFNDVFVDIHTKTAYVEIQKNLNITDTGTYGKQQVEFLKDKAANKYETLSKYVDDKSVFKVANKDVVANLILSMSNNKDPVLQEAFNKIIEDKVLSIKEVEDFNDLIIKHKMESL